METIIDVLLDADNRDPIRLGDEHGHDILFEQVAVIPHNGKLYCVLKPITPMEGVADDEARVFYVEEPPHGPPYLKIETDELAVLDVFEEYYNLLEGRRKK